MIYIIINVILVIFMVFLIKVGFLSKMENHVFEFIDAFINKHYKLLVFILFALMVFTSLYQFGAIPAGMHVDEGGMAYDAWLLSEYGMDRYLNKWPVYLINYGGGQSALYAYLAAIFIKIFGYSIIAIRMPAFICRLFMFISGYFLVNDENNKTKSLLLLFLLAIVPYFILQSRWGLDCNLLVSLLTISVCFFVKAINKNNNKLLFLSGLFFGITLYTYALSYIIIPLLLLFIVIYLLYLKKINLKKLFIFGFPIFILALPLMLMILVNNGILNEINSFITIPLLPQYRGAEISLTNIITNIYIIPSILSFDNLSLLGGPLIYNSIPYFGTLYYISIPFVFVGFVQCVKKLVSSIKNKQFDSSCVIMFWTISVLSCMFVIKEPNINKANAIFFPLVYFIVLGIIKAIQVNKKVFIPIILLYIVNFSMFSYYYFNHYNKDYNYQPYFATSYLEALNYGRSLKKSNIYIEEYLAVQEHIYVLLNNFVSPYNYHGNGQIITTYQNKQIIYTFFIPHETDDNAVYIVSANSQLADDLKHRGFNEFVFDYISVFSR